jgi:hypothetical protein
MNLLYETKILYKKETLGWTCYTTSSSKSMAFVVYFGWNIIVKLIWAEKYAHGSCQNISNGAQYVIL